MRILQIDPSPIYEIPYLNAAPGGGKTITATLPVFSAVVDTLPEDIDMLLVTSDLQGRTLDDERRLLGHQVAEELAELAEVGLLPNIARTGVVLAGDLFAEPDLTRRGGIGDVDDVWLAFAKHYRWVTGVAGNHDQFSGRHDFAQVFAGRGQIHPLDGNTIIVDDLKISGISGVIGQSGKPWRKSAKQFANLSQALLGRRPDVFVVHDNPDIPSHREYSGNPQVREALAPITQDTLVICGHRHWKFPVGRFGENNTQILNVEGRVVLLVRKSIVAQYFTATGDNVYFDVTIDLDYE